MNEDYVWSVEQYKGYELKVVSTQIGNGWHRRCRVSKDGKEIAISKTKKESKELIDGGYYEMIIGGTK